MNPILHVLVPLLPYFLSGTLYTSVLLAVFAPLPLLLLSSQQKWAQLFPAIATNAALVFWVGGTQQLVAFVSVVVSTVLGLSFFLFHKRWRLDTALLSTVIFTCLVIVGVLIGFVYQQNPSVESWRSILNPGNWGSWVTVRLDAFTNAALTQQFGKNIPPELNVKELQETFIRKLPSWTLIGVMLIGWANLVLLYKINPPIMALKMGIKTDFWSRWKAPDFLVWPTLIVAGVLVFTQATSESWMTVVADNVLYVFLTIYGFQGLSIWSFMMDRMHVRGFWRALGYVAVIFWPITLLMVCMGFFDLWFDFRAKMGQMER